MQIGMSIPVAYRNNLKFKAQGSDEELNQLRARNQQIELDGDDSAATEKAQNNARIGELVEEKAEQIRARFNTTG